MKHAETWVSDEPSMLPYHWTDVEGRALCGAPLISRRPDHDAEPYQEYRCRRCSALLAQQTPAEAR